MKNLTFLMLLMMALVFTACDVDKTERAELPEVDVDVEEGNMPEYDVDWVNVDVSTRTKTVEVPKVMVVMEEREVEVPVIKANIPDGETVERTIRVEAEVTGEMKELEIQKLYATENNLYVISELESTGENLDNKTVRVSDQVIIDAPEGLVVRHYIVGEKQERSFNNDYKYITSADEIEDKLQGGQEIFTR